MALKREDIIIRFGGDDSKFQKVANGVKNTGKQIAGFFGTIGNQIQAVFTRGVVGLIGGVGAAFTALARDVLKTGDELSKTSAKLGVTVEELQQLRYAAKASGVDQGTLDMALQRFSRRVGEAANGTGELRADLERLRIPLRDADGNMRSLADIMADYADAVRDAESPQEQLRLAFKAFDSEGAALVNMLRDGSAGLEELTNRADELGLVIDTNTAKALERMNQAWSDWVDQTWAKVKNSFAEMVVELDRVAGNVRTVEDAQARLQELDELLVQTQKDKANSLKIFAPLYDYRIRQIKEERDAVLEEVDALKKLDDAERRRNQNQPPTPPTATQKTGDKRTSRRAESEDWRDKTPEEIAAALNDFRAGRITQTELGERAGLQPPGTAAATPRGAYGTESNTASGAFDDGGIVVLTQQGLEDMDARIAEWLRTHEYIIKVRPELIGLEGIESAARPAAYRAGGRE